MRQPFIVTRVKNKRNQTDEKAEIKLTARFEKSVTLTANTRTSNRIAIH